jgi:hypothetical protein
MIENLIHSENYQSFIFVHLEKCAGTSIRQLIYNTLKNKYPPSRLFIPGFTHDEDDNLIYLSPTKLKELAQKNIFCVADHSNYGFAEKSLALKNPFYFTLLREPLARFISHYYFFSIYENNIGLNLPDLQGIQRQQVLENAGVLNLMTLKLSGNLEWNNAMSYSEKELLLEQSLPIAKQNLMTMGSFGLLEDMNNSFKWLNSNNPFDFYFNYQERQKRANQSQSNKPINDHFIQSFQQYARFDIELYQFAVTQFKKNIALLKN